MQTPTTGFAVVTPDPRRGTGFLEESPGNSSAMRLMCMMSLITAIALSVLVIGAPPYKSVNEKGQTSYVYPARDPQAVYLIFGFLVAAFAPKAIQKFAEQKLPVYDPTLPMGQPTSVVVQQPVMSAFLPPQQPSTGMLPVALTGSNGQSQPFTSTAITNSGSQSAEAIMATSSPSRLQALKDRGAL